MTHLNKLREAELFEVQRVRVSDGVVIVGKYDVGHLVLPVVVCHKGLVDGVADTIVITRGIRTTPTDSLVQQPEKCDEEIRRSDEEE